MKKLGITVLVVAAVAAPAALAGGWATVGLSSLPPQGLAAGADWPVEVTVLQHGRTPLAGVRPTITVRDVATGEIGGTFAAKPTGKTGVYSAVVRFPRAGTWSYEVYDGFTAYGNAQMHTFKHVTIGTGGGGTSLWLAAAAVALALALLGAAAVVVRRHHHAPELRPARL